MKNYKDYWRNKLGRLIMKLALLIGGVSYRSEQLFCQCKNPAQWTTDEGFTGCVKCNKEIKAK